MDKTLLYRFLRCETTPTEETLIAEWLDASPKHRQELEALQFIFNGVALHTPEKGLAVRPSLTQRIGAYALRIAAVLVVVAGVGYATHRYTHDNLSSRLTSITVPPGQRVNITLEDGTSVWLNSGTTMEYPVVFAARQRHVKISGEAMFEVTHDASRPFTVETFACDVEVLGTKFNVLAEPAQGVFSTMLLAGSVRVTNRLHSGQQVVLKPDEIVSLVDGCLRTHEIDDRCALRWPEGLISVRNQPFEVLMARFEKAYGVQIVIERQQMPRMNDINGKLRVADGIDHALKVLQYSAEFTFIRDEESNVITIR